VQRYSASGSEVDLLFVSPYYPPYAIGGAEESAFALARALRERGHAVRVLAPRLGPEPPQGNVPVETIELGLRLEEPGKPLPPRVFDGLRLQWRFSRAVARAAGPSDLVHCQTLHLLPAAYMGARRAGVPIVATIRDLAGVCPVAVCLLDAPRVPHDCSVVKLETTCVPRYLELYGGSRSRARVSAAALVRFATARARSRLLGRCDAIYAVGSDLGPLYGEAGLVDSSRVEVLPNITDQEPAARDAPARPYALYAGKVSHGKGVGVLLEAVGRVRRSEPAFRLLVAGYADEGWRRRLAGREGVEHLGRLPRGRLSELYSRASFTVMPSIWPEPLGRVALESSICSTPVVASAVGGIPDVVVDGETGVLVEPRNADALAEAMLRLWNDPEAAHAMGAAAHERASERFSAAAIGARAERLYERVLGGRAA
jgi:glycogen(starch) synthase